MYKKNVLNNITFLKYNLNDSTIKFNDTVNGLSIINASNSNITKKPGSCKYKWEKINTSSIIYSTFDETNNSNF